MAARWHRERQCVTCGRTFTSGNRVCSGCRAIERECKTCGKTFKGAQRACGPCQVRERDCATCGRTFRGKARNCDACRKTPRQCTECGKSFEGTRRKCSSCRMVDRECGTCGTTFAGLSNTCVSCQVADRRCETCDRPMRQTNRQCHQCRKSHRRCAQCDWTFYGMQSRCATCRGGPARRARHARMRQLDEVLPAETYRAVIASGPCVYCGGRANTADHVRPISQGGADVVENLVPACRSCNSSKHSALLTEWHRQDLVAYAVQVSPVAAAEWDRLVGLASDAVAVPVEPAAVAGVAAV